MGLKGHEAGRLRQGPGAQASTQPGVGGIRPGGFGSVGGRRRDLGVSGTAWVDAGGESRAAGWEVCWLSMLAHSYSPVHSPHFWVSWGCAPGGGRTSPLSVLLSRQEPRQLVPQVPQQGLHRSLWARASEEAEGVQRGAPTHSPCLGQDGLCESVLRVHGRLPSLVCPSFSLGLSGTFLSEHLNLPAGSTLFPYRLFDSSSTWFQLIFLALR